MIEVEILPLVRRCLLLGFGYWLLADQRSMATMHYMKEDSRSGPTPNGAVNAQHRLKR
jgi:hypothetical protein